MAIYMDEETKDIFKFISNVSSKDETLNKRLQIVNTEKIKAYKGDNLITVYEIYDDYFDSTFFLHDCLCLDKSVYVSILDSKDGKVYITDKMDIDLKRVFDEDLFNYIIGRELD